jgi:hypothetical protein
MTPADLIASAQSLLTRTDPATAGLWPRAAALLARQALEEALDDFWRRKAIRLGRFSTRPQLICLESYAGHQIAGRVNHAWSALTRACHHHAYELAPSLAEMQSLLDTVIELQARGTATSSSGGGLQPCAMAPIRWTKRVAELNV